MKRILILLLTVAALQACRQSAPVIGITCSRYAGGVTYLNSTYTDAVAKSGGLPVIFPTVSDEAMAEALVASVSGVILSGGEDLDPSYYGESVWNGTVEVDTLRDVSDLMLARAAVAAGKPVLAICRGEQVMNVVLGGSLYQDLPTQFGERVAHGGGTRHRIGVEKGSVLYELFGQDSLTVNSFHHQAVNREAPGIRVTARAADGIVEAYEYGDRIIAVQFHPEAMVRSDESWLALFRHFVRMSGGK